MGRCLKYSLMMKGLKKTCLLGVKQPDTKWSDWKKKPLIINGCIKPTLRKPNEYFLVTAHRSENVDDPDSLKQILEGLKKIHSKFGKKIIYPIHPRTLDKLKGMKIPKGITTIKPLGFIDFCKLEKNALCMITDSGTIPEESLYFKKPCVTIRESTERPEYIEAGASILSGLNPKNILESTNLIMSHNSDWDWDVSLGDGKTASKVVNILRGKSRKILEV